MTISFYQYIMRCVKDNNAIGDLARDVMMDSSFPKHSENYYEIVGHLSGKGAIQECIDAFELAYKDYKRHCYVKDGS